MTGRLSRVAEVVGKVGAVGAGIGLVFMSLGVASGAISRYVFNNPLNWTEEFAGGLMIPLSFLPLLYVLILGKHFRVGIIANRFPRRVRDILLIVNSLLALAYGGFIVYEGVRLTQEHIYRQINYIFLPLPKIVT